MILTTSTIVSMCSGFSDRIEYCRGGGGRRRAVVVVVVSACLAQAPKLNVTATSARSARYFMLFVVSPLSVPVGRAGML